jgi:hypothetical protein
LAIGLQVFTGPKQGMAECHWTVLPRRLRVGTSHLESVRQGLDQSRFQRPPVDTDQAEDAAHDSILTHPATIQGFERWAILIRASILRHWAEER